MSLPELLNPQTQIHNLQYGDPGEKYYAAWWLGRMRLRQGIPALVEALQDTSDRTEQGGYPLRRNAARALAKLGDPSGIPVLVQCLHSEDGQLCGAAAQAISEIALVADLLVDQPLVAQAAAALLAWLHNQNHQEPYASEAALEGVIEALGSLRVVQAQGCIERFLNHVSIRVQCASLRAMFQLTTDPGYAHRLCEFLDHDNIHLRRGALLDLGSLGYLPMAARMASCAVEANIKLLAFKAMIDAHLRVDPSLSPAVRQVLDLIDALI